MVGSNVGGRVVGAVVEGEAVVGLCVGLEVVGSKEGGCVGMIVVGDTDDGVMVVGL